MSNNRANKPLSKATASSAKSVPASATATPTTVSTSPTDGTAGKSRSGSRMYNRYVICLGSIVLVLLASRVSITPGHSSEDKDKTISVGESNVAAVYRDDPFGSRVPVDSIVKILAQVGFFFERTLNPNVSLVGWIFNREASKLSKSLTEIATEMKQDWTGSIMKSAMMEKTCAVLDSLIATIEFDPIESAHYTHNANINPTALAGELKLLIEIISETLTGNQMSEQQSPSLRTAIYIDYMNIKVDKVLLPDIIKEYVVLFRQMGYEKVLLGLRQIFVEWRDEFKLDS